MKRFLRGTPDAIEGTDRIESVSDNIFAVAMTLLIVNIKVPVNGGFEDTAHVLPLVLPLWHHLRAFGLSFLIIGLYWMAHHRIFAFIKRSDAWLLLINLAFMGFTVLTPFFSGLLGQFDESRVALGLYGLNIICISCTLQAVWWYASSKHRLVDADLPAQIIRYNSVRNLIVPVVCSLAIALSFFNHEVSLWLYLVLPISFFLPYARRQSNRQEQ